MFVETPSAPAVEGALSPGAPEPRAGVASRLGGALGLSGPLALAFAALSAGLLAGFPRTAVRDAAFGWPERVALVGGEVVLACGAGFAAAGLLGLSERLRRRAGRRERFVVAAGVGVAWFLTFAYASSWALFWAFGSFLDASSLLFFVTTGKLLVKHVLDTNPVLLVLLPVVALGVVLAARRGLGVLTGRLSTAGRRRLLLVSLGVSAVSALATAWGATVPAESFELVRDQALGTRLELGRAYRTARAHRGGPFSHLLFGAIAPPGSGPELSADDVTRRHLHVIRKPQVPLAPWVAALDRGKLHSYNVVLLLFDSAQPTVLRTLGGTTDVMPRVDELAQASLRFSMYAQASHSNYADPAVLSSHYPLRDPRHHEYPKSPPYPRVLVFDVLKQLGYRTGLVSSQNEHWGNMHAYFDTGGLDHFFHSESLAGAAIPDADPGFAAWAKQWGRSGKIDDRDTIDEAIRFIGQAPPDKPFFLYVNLQNSHFPYHVPDGFPRRFQPETIDFPYAFGNYPKDKVDVVKNRWRNSLAYVDQQIGRLLDHVKATGAFERTLFVIGADNGEAFYEHETVCHAGPIFDESVRVPVILHGPGVPSGTFSGLSQAIDLTPTVLGRLGLPPHPSFQGLDLLQTPAVVSRSVHVVAQTPKANQLALVRDGWKLIYDYWYDAYLLYDLTRDPGEKQDRSRDETGRLRVMATELRAWERAQLDYYASPELMRTTYPPVLSFSSEEAAR
jgi:arylsulfatase A-like enzyme